MRQFKLQLCVAVGLLIFLILLLSTGCNSQTDSEVEKRWAIDSIKHEVRAQVIDSLKQLYEELQATKLEMKDDMPPAWYQGEEVERSKEQATKTVDPTTQFRYKGKPYPIETGPKGGKYIMVDGEKKYIKSLKQDK